MLVDDSKETTDNEDGKWRETELLTTFSSEQTKGITPNIAKTTSFSLKIGVACTAEIAVGKFGLPWSCKRKV